MKTRFAAVTRSAALALIASVAGSAGLSAQIYRVQVPPLRRTPVVVNLPAPTCGAAPIISLRGLPYQDYSAYASKSATSVPVAGAFSITVNCMPWNGTTKVVLQDVSAPTQIAGGLTGVFELRGFARSGNTLTVQGPGAAYFAGKTFYISVDVLGALPNKHAAVGSITFL